MLFYIFVISQFFYSVSSLISCYNCPFDKNSYDYFITSSNFPSELRNCTLETNASNCFIEVYWTRNPDNTKITLVAQTDTKAASGDHGLAVSLGYEYEKTAPVWTQLIFYECGTDECNSPNQLKRILQSLVISETLGELKDLLDHVKPFQGESCTRASNVTFTECNTTVPVSSCKQCSLMGIINQTRTEVCATCLTDDDDDKTLLTHGKVFNMADRTFTTNWMIICEKVGCNSLQNGDMILEKSHISFDFNGFLNGATENRLPLILLIILILFQNLI